MAEYFFLKEIDRLDFESVDCSFLHLFSSFSSILCCCRSSQAHHLQIHWIVVISDLRFRWMAHNCPAVPDGNQQSSLCCTVICYGVWPFPPLVVFRDHPRGVLSPWPPTLPFALAASTPPPRATARRRPPMPMPPPPALRRCAWPTSRTGRAAACWPPPPSPLGTSSTAAPQLPLSAPSPPGSYSRQKIGVLRGELG